MKKFFSFRMTLMVAVALLAAVLPSFGQPSPSANRSAPAGGKSWVYIGTYTGPKSKGIYVARLDRATGKLTEPELAGETVSPSFLAIHSNHRFLYAANETESLAGKKGGGVAAFAIDAETGKLTLLNQQSSGGQGPCHLAVDKTGKFVLVANYGSGSIEALPIQPDGRLGEPTAFIQHQGTSANPQRQDGPHAHFITTDAANRFALTCDLGLDKVLVYRFDATKGSLIANDPPSGSVKPGSGPRHLAFHPQGKFAYVINEMACTLTAFAYDGGKGELKELQTVSTLPPPQSVRPGYSTAEIEVHPTGKFVYGSNRGHDSIVVFAIDQKTGRLTYVQHQSTAGKTPRNFGIDPSGSFLLAANQGSDNVVVFRIDPKTGQLSPTGNVVAAPTPVCIAFVAER
jgi:6-phosphogluconolactonase